MRPTSVSRTQHSSNPRGRWTRIRIRAAPPGDKGKGRAFNKRIEYVGVVGEPGPLASSWPSSADSSDVHLLRRTHIMLRRRLGRRRRHQHRPDGRFSIVSIIVVLKTFRYPQELAPTRSGHAGRCRYCGSRHRSRSRCRRRCPCSDGRSPSSGPSDTANR